MIFILCNLSYNRLMFTLLKAEIRIPISIAFFACIGIPIVFMDELGTFTAICFSLASLVFFIVFAILPYTHRQELDKIRDSYHPIYRSTAQKKMANAKIEYYGTVKLWLAAGIVLIVIGVISRLLR